jgi:lysophospholipase L1-like esterase
MTNILVFGDSITHGACDIKGGWAQRLKEFLDEKILDGNEDYPSLYNLGVSGDTTELLLERFEPELKGRLDTDENMIMIAIGANDSSILDETKEFWVPSAKFKENIQKLIEISKKYSKKIIFVGLTLVEEPKVSPFHGGIDIHYRNENLKKYNEILKNLSQENEVFFIEIMEEWKKLDYFKFLYDGIHPNSDGHKMIYEIIRDFLLEKDLI